MKKFLLPMLVTFAVLIPTITVEAAYVLVPNFRDITSNRIEERIRFINMEQRRSDSVSYTGWN